MNDDRERMENRIQYQLSRMSPADRLRAVQMAKHRAEGRSEADVRERMHAQAAKRNRRAARAKA